MQGRPQPAEIGDGRAMDAPNRNGGSESGWIPGRDEPPRPSKRTPRKPAGGRGECRRRDPNAAHPRSDSADRHGPIRSRETRAGRPPPPCGAGTTAYELIVATHNVTGVSRHKFRKYRVIRGSIRVVCRGIGRDYLKRLSRDSVSNGNCCTNIFDRRGNSKGKAT